MADKQLDQLQFKLAPHEVPSLVPESFITASGGSPSNPQQSWGLLASAARMSPICSGLGKRPWECC
jgi:hypothetical protein